MFFTLLDKIEAAVSSVGAGRPVGKAGFLTLLEKAASGESLDLQDSVELIDGTRSPENAALLIEFAAAQRRPRDREILLLPPLYFSSLCENSCLYCDFSSGGLRLSLDEFSREMDALLETGYRSIELVCGQDPELFERRTPFRGEDQHFSLSKLISYFNLAREKIDAAGGGMLTSNIPPVDAQGFKDLKAAGLDCYLSWLETFDRAQYRKLHAAGSPKAYQAFRLDSFDRAFEAGISHAAGAFLKGLYDWRKEELALYALDRDLKRRRGRGFSIIGTPRLKGRFLSAGSVKGYAVSDEDFELNLALDRVLFDGILWLQTRESPEMNRKMIRKYGAGVILTITCSTAPGGYHTRFRTKAQFPVYLQDLHRTVGQYEADGFTVRFDWDAGALSGFQRSAGAVPGS